MNHQRRAEQFTMATATKALTFEVEITWHWRKNWIPEKPNRSRHRSSRIRPRERGCRPRANRGCRVNPSPVLRRKPSFLRPAIGEGIRHRTLPLWGRGEPGFVNRPLTGLESECKHTNNKNCFTSSSTRLVIWPGRCQRWCGSGREVSTIFQRIGPTTTKIREMNFCANCKAFRRRAIYCNWDI